MRQGILYGVGIGPGDPELLTLKAVRVLRQADVLAVPDKGSGRHLALEIVGEYGADKPLLYCDAPMTRDPKVLEDAYDKNARAVCQQLEQGKNVAFITLGDPTVYSTYFYIHERVKSSGYEAQVVPGVPSFCAAAARLGRPLCLGSQRLLVVPGSHGSVDESLDTDANLVFMKTGRSLDELRGKLRERSLKASAVVNCGMEDERVYEDLEEMEGSDYFTLILVDRGEDILLEK